MTIKQLTIDVWRKYSEPITAIQYEASGRDLHITLVGNDLPIDLTNSSVQFFAIKPDDEIIYNDCTILDAVRGKIQYTLTGQACAVAGELKCWIEVVKEESVLRTHEFKIAIVKSSDSTGAIESTSEFTALETALSTVGQYDSRIGGLEDTVEQYDSRIETLEDSVGEGWTAAGETWTRTSDYTFTIDGDKSNKYQPRDKFKLTQDGTVKYGWIVKVGYSGGVTTVTTSLDTTLSTGAITDNYYSRAATPQGFNLNRVYLWSGTASPNDVITVPGFRAFSQYIIMYSSVATYMTCYTSPGAMRGIGGQTTENGTTVFGFSGSHSGEEVTISFCGSMTMPPGEVNGPLNSTRTLSSIYGVV